MTATAPAAPSPAIPDAKDIVPPSHRHPALPPGPRMSRVAMTGAWMFRPGPFLLRQREEFGDVFTMRVGQEPPWVILSDPEHIRQVFTGPPEILQAGAGNRVLVPFTGSASVLVLDGKEHLRQRRLLLPPFHGERMASYRDEIAAIAEREIASWPTGEPLSLWPRMQAVTLEVILRVVFGMRDGERLAPLRDNLRAMLDALLTPRAMIVMAMLGPDRADRLGVYKRTLRTIDSLLYEEIRARRSAQPSAERTDVLSLLLQARDEDGEPMSDKELRDELVTLLVAGHETTATTLSWAVEQMTRLPGAWGELRAGGEDHAEAVAMEALRIRPVLPIVNRKLAQPWSIAGYDLPAGAAVVPCIYLVHRRPDIYPDPERFVPTRFLGNKPGTYSWIPFGGGVRRCIGASFALLEARLVLDRMAAAFIPEPATDRPERTRRRAITLTPEHGTRVVLRAA